MSALARMVLVAFVLLAACTSHVTPFEPAPAEVVEEAPPIRATRLILGVSSYYGENVAASMRPLVAHLSKVLGIPVRLRVAEAYRELPFLLRTGQVDVAQLPPLAYVLLKDALPGIIAVATPIIGGSPTYLGHLYVRDDSPYQTLADLRGARVGYVSPESSSGYLFARDLLRGKGHDPDAFFVKSTFYTAHPQVLAAVTAGDVDVGAALDATSDWTGPLDRPKGLRVIGKTQRIPNDCFAARDGYDSGTIFALRRELIRLRPGEPAAQQVLSSLRVNGWVRAEETRYDRVRAVLSREAHQ